MGIAIGTTITVTFDAKQIAQLDCVLQEFEMKNYMQENEHQKINVERVDNIFRALHAAGYR
jgi:ribosome-associated toxin RatA of RatAB toxin-antitoxin module